MPFASGGFLGVDVFFVISGFLITKILLTKLLRDDFSFLQFYENRIRRIIPALLVVTVFSTALSLVCMVPYSIKNYGQSLVATMLSANNILLYLTSGYWSLAAEFKPLYHTWTLAVEEQYYVIAPLLLYATTIVARPRRVAVLIVLSAILVTSFLSSLLSNDKEFNFLFIFSRAWELSAGALLALFQHDHARGNVFLSSLGVGLLLLSYIHPYIVSANQAIVNLAPVIGTVLIIRFSRPENVTGRLLSIKPLTLIGLISYSIYLWHQPILSFVRLRSDHEPNSVVLAGLTLLSIPIAYLSWRYVETVFRDRRLVRSTNLYWFVGCGLTLNLLLGFAMHKTYGFQVLWPNLSYGLDPQLYVDEVRRFAKTFYDDDGKRKVLVVGNSFARDYVNVMKEAGHLPLVDLVYADSGCSSIEQGQIDALLAKSQLVVYSEDWGRGDTAAEKEVSTVMSCLTYMRERSPGKVFVLGVKNFGWNNDFVRIVGDSYWKARAEPIDGVRRFNNEAKKRMGSSYIDVIGVLADEDGCVPLFTDERRFITYDTNHLTPAGALHVGRKIFEKYRVLAPNS